MKKITQKPSSVESVYINPRSFEDAYTRLFFRKYFDYYDYILGNHVKEKELTEKQLVNKIKKEIKTIKNS